MKRVFLTLVLSPDHFILPHRVTWITRRVQYKLHDVHRFMIFCPLLSVTQVLSQNCKQKLSASSCLSVCLHETTLPHLRDFHRTWYFSIIKNQSTKFKIGWEKQVLYMETYVYLWQQLAEFFLEWEMFHKIKTHILCSVPFFWKSCHLWHNVKNIWYKPHMTIPA